eukprot:2631281-Rhodomonas_salina.1
MSEILYQHVQDPGTDTPPAVPTCQHKLQQKCLTEACTLRRLGARRKRSDAAPRRWSCRSYPRTVEAGAAVTTRPETRNREEEKTGQHCTKRNALSISLSLSFSPPLSPLPHALSLARSTIPLSSLRSRSPLLPLSILPLPQPPSPAPPPGSLSHRPPPSARSRALTCVMMPMSSFRWSSISSDGASPRLDSSLRYCVTSWLIRARSAGSRVCTAEQAHPTSVPDSAWGAPRTLSRACIGAYARSVPDSA